MQENKTLKRQLSKAQEKVQQKDEEVVALREKIEQLTNELQQASIHHREVIQCNAGNVEELKNRTNAWELECNRLTASLDKAQNKRASRTTSRDTARNLCKKLKRRDNTIEHITTVNAKLTTEKERTTEELEETTTQLDQMKEQVKILKVKKRNLSKQCSKLRVKLRVPSQHDKIYPVDLH